MENNNLVYDKYSLRGRTFNQIREDILLGKYKANEELKEVTIGKELGVSRTPVREALRQLELEGLVKIIPNRGAFVTGISIKDIQDIYVIRSLLEGLCARWATKIITKEQISVLEEIVYLSKFHSSKGNYDQVFALDNKFHEEMYQACGSEILKHSLSEYHHYLERVRKVTLSREERVNDSNSEHEAILEAIKAGDELLAEKLANEHIINTIKNITNKGLENILSENPDSCNDIKTT